MRWATDASGVPICQYCGSHPLRLSGRELLPDRPEIAHRRFLACRDCDAWVLCREGEWTPFGNLANAHLRADRRRAFELLEALWRSAASASTRSQAEFRNAAYAWLSKVMGGDEPVHISGLDHAECARVATLVSSAPDLIALMPQPKENAPRRYRPKKSHRRTN